MKLTVKFLQQKSACSSGMDWYEKNGNPDTVEVCITALCADPNPTETLSYANWLLSKTLDDDNCRWYAIYAARQVSKIYTRKYPDDMRPQTAIEAAEKYLKTHSADDRAVAWAARAAAWAAARAAAWAAGAAAEAAAEAAAWAAGAAAWAAGSAAWAAAGTAAGAAARAAGSAEGEKILRIIISYGVVLLKKQEAGHECND